MQTEQRNHTTTNYFIVSRLNESFRRPQPAACSGPVGLFLGQNPRTRRTCELGLHRDTGLGRPHSAFQLTGHLPYKLNVSVCASQKKKKNHQTGVRDYGFALDQSCPPLSCFFYDGFICIIVQHESQKTEKKHTHTSSSCVKTGDITEADCPRNMVPMFIQR